MQSAAGYQEMLSGVQADAVMLRHSAAWRPDCSVCGEVPVFCESETVQLADDTFSLQISDENVQLQWNAVQISVCGKNAEPAENADAVIRYGDAAEYTVTLRGRTDQGSNLLLRFAKDGSCGVSSAG